MVNATQPTQRRIFLGMVIGCPISERIVKFAYHIEPLGEEVQTDRDFSYLLPNDGSLVQQLNILKCNYSREEIILANGIPKSLSKGWAPEYKFYTLPDIEFDEIRKRTGLESKV